MRRSPAGRILITKVGISSKQAKTFAFFIEAFQPFISRYYMFTRKNGEFFEKNFEKNLKVLFRSTLWYLNYKSYIRYENMNKRKERNNSAVALIIPFPYFSKTKYSKCLNSAFLPKIIFRVWLDLNF